MPRQEYKDAAAEKAGANLQQPTAQGRLRAQSCPSPKLPFIASVAVFASLAASCRQYGNFARCANVRGTKGTIDAKEIGYMKNNNVNHEKRAYIAWPILTGCAKNKEIITYEEIAKQLNIHHRAVRYILGLIQDYCLEEKLPPLTILVVNKKTRIPGDGFVAWDVDNVNDGVKKVFDYNWSVVSNPFEYAKNDNTKDSLVEKLIENPSKSGEVYSLVKNRGIVQKMFRDALMQVYNCSCAFCGFSFEEVLEAAHIIPYSKCDIKQKLDVRNGLLLCANHHKLFDNGYITINDSYKMIYIDPEMKESEYSKSDKASTVNAHNRKISLPQDQLKYPNKLYLKKHRELFISDNDE